MAGSGTSAYGTTQHEIQAGNTLATKASVPNFGGTVQDFRCTLTVDASSGSGSGGALISGDEINILLVPPGKTKIKMAECKRRISADQGATSTFDIGYRAHTKNDGTEVAEDSNGLVADGSADVTTIQTWKADTFGTPADSDYADELTRFESIIFDSKTPFALFYTAKDGGGTYDGDLGDTLDFVVVMERMGS